MSLDCLNLKTDENPLRKICCASSSLTPILKPKIRMQNTAGVAISLFPRHRFSVELPS